MEKHRRIADLFDFYAPLLTKKQREFIEYYYHHDLSLGEIAEQYGISRQAVYDTLRRTEKVLETYERKLGLLGRYRARQQMLIKLSHLFQNGEQKNFDKNLPIIMEILRLLMADGENEEA
ncbi:MAG: YlxM family DNA-binding protein [Bacillota bacterium]